MSRVVGVEHDEMPKTAKPLIQVSYADAPRKDAGRLEWHLKMGSNVCRTIADTGGAFKAFSGILEELGEEPAWKFLAKVATNNGFDVYDSDTVFSVFRGHTDPGDNSPRSYALEVHESGIEVSENLFLSWNEVPTFIRDVIDAFLNRAKEALL